MKPLPDYEIRAAIPTDETEYKNLRLALHGESEYLRLSPQEKSALQIFEAIKDQILWLGFSEIMPVAFLSASYDPQVKKIHHVQLGVRQSHAGRGIGRRLFDTLEAWAESIGACAIELKAMTHNRVALEMYLRRGFNVIETSRFPLYENEKMVEDYLLRKDLRPTT